MSVHSQPAPLGSADLGLPDATRGPRILLVDADIRRRLVCERALRSGLPHAIVVHVGTARQLTTALTGPEPDAIVVEQLPDWVGAARVRDRLDASWPAAPVVVLGRGTAPDVIGEAYVDLLAADWPELLAAAARAAIRPDLDSPRPARPAALLESVPVPVFRARPDGTIAEANPAWRRTFDASGDDPLHETSLVDMFADPVDAERLAENERAAGVRVHEFDARRRDGSTFRARLSAQVVTDKSGRVLFLDGVVDDVSALKCAEEELRRTQGKLLAARKYDAFGRLASGAVHDFNNVITTILGFADLARRSVAEGSPAVGYLDEIDASAHRAAELAFQLLAFGREQGLRPRVVDLNEVVSEIGRLLRRAIREDVHLDLELCEETLPVSADAGQLEQMIVSLAVHARDAMPAGGRLVLTTSAECLDVESGLAPGVYAALSVSDTGEADGAAAGLDTVAAIAAECNGRLELRTNESGGSTARVLLPRSGGLPESDSRLEASGERPSGTELVLLVEDDDRLRFVMRRILEDAGYEVLAARGGDDAEAALAEAPRRPDLVVCDVILRDGGGMEVAARLGSEGSSAPVLFVSGHDDAVLVQRGVLAEGSRYLAKPFTAEALLQRVRATLDGN